MNYKQIYAIKEKNKKRILDVCRVPNGSGIYVLTREEDGIRYAYVGQAVHLLDRLADHLNGHQEIDHSLKKRGLYSEANKGGYKISFELFPVDELDLQERAYIHKYANNGYQLYNKTTGGQGTGKKGMDNARHPKGYYDGLKQGYKNAQRDVAKWMKHLDVRIKSEKGNKIQERALEHLKEFIN